LIPRTVIQVLEQMKWLIETVGWSRQSYDLTSENTIVSQYPRRGFVFQFPRVGWRLPIKAFSLKGALLAIDCSEELIQQVHKLLYQELLHTHFCNETSMLINWNDQSNRTKEDIIELIDQCISKEKTNDSYRYIEQDKGVASNKGLVQ